MAEEAFLVVWGAVKSFSEEIDDLFDILITKVVRIESILEQEAA